LPTCGLVMGILAFAVLSRISSDLYSCEAIDDNAVGTSMIAGIVPIGLADIPRYSSGGVVILELEEAQTLGEVGVSDTNLKTFICTPILDKVQIGHLGTRLSNHTIH